MTNSKRREYSPRPSPFVICHLSSVLRHPPSAICHLPSVTCHLPSAICHLPSAICHLPFAIRHSPHLHRTIMPSPRAGCPSISTPRSLHSRNGSRQRPQDAGESSFGVASDGRDTFQAAAIDSQPPSEQSQSPHRRTGSWQSQRNAQRFACAARTNRSRNLNRRGSKRTSKSERLRNSERIAARLRSMRAKDVQHRRAPDRAAAPRRGGRWSSLPRPGFAGKV